MKMKGAKAVHYDSGPNMTPLVDVVMVILIFLMLTGSFGAASHFLPSSMPITSKGKGAVDPSKIPKVPDPQLEVFVATISGEMYRARIGTGEEFNNGVSKGGKTLVQALKETKAKYGADVDKLQVILSPRASTKYEHIIEVYQAAMEAECKKIGFQSARD